MRAAFSVCLVLALTLSAASARASEALAGVPWIESSLPTDGHNIRQRAFDGDAKTYFRSSGKVGAKDHFTLVFDKPVEVKSVEVLTGLTPDDAKPADDGTPAPLDRLASGALEFSTDGKTFVKFADFADGLAKGTPAEKKIQALRVQPAADHEHALIVREIALDTEPAIQPFLHPIEFTIDVVDAPEMKEWAEKVVRICERSYPMLNEELKSEGYVPTQRVTMALKNDYRGVAAASRGYIVGSVKFFKDHPDDIGAMVHETAHIVQSYRGRGNPGWLVEGVADYVRFFKYEPGNLGRLNIERARYDGSYRVTAAFLNYLVEKYDKDIVKKLNQAMREGKYKEEIFKESTGKDLEELNNEWRAHLKKPA